MAEYVASSKINSDFNTSINKSKSPDPTSQTLKHARGFSFTNENKFKGSPSKTNYENLNKLMRPINIILRNDKSISKATEGYFDDDSFTDNKYFIKNMNGIFMDPNEMKKHEEDMQLTKRKATKLRNVAENLNKIKTMKNVDSGTFLTSCNDFYKVEKQQTQPYLSKQSSNWSDSSAENTFDKMDPLGESTSLKKTLPPKYYQFIKEKLNNKSIDDDDSITHEKQEFSYNTLLQDIISAQKKMNGEIDEIAEIRKAIKATKKNLQTHKCLVTNVKDNLHVMNKIAKIAEDDSRPFTSQNSYSPSKATRFSPTKKYSSSTRPTRPQSKRIVHQGTNFLVKKEVDEKERKKFRLNLAKLGNSPGKGNDDLASPLSSEGSNRINIAILNGKNLFRDLSPHKYVAENREDRPITSQVPAKASFTNSLKEQISRPRNQTTSAHSKTAQTHIMNKLINMNGCMKEFNETLENKIKEIGRTGSRSAISRTPIKQPSIPSITSYGKCFPSINQQVPVEFNKTYKKSFQRATTYGTYKTQH